MIRYFHRIALAIAVVAAGSVPGAQAKKVDATGRPTPTFDCHKPRGTVAKAICESREYRAIDREIAALTDRAKAELTPAELSQLGASTARWLRQRNGCEWAAHHSAHPGTAIDECVRASLEERVRRLRDVVARSGT